MKKTMSSDDRVMLFPETPEEAGLLYWLFYRFKDKKVTLLFDATDHDHCDDYPAMWIEAVDSTLT